MLTHRISISGPRADSADDIKGRRFSDGCGREGVPTAVKRIVTLRWRCARRRFADGRYAGVEDEIDISRGDILGPDRLQRWPAVEAEHSCGWTSVPLDPKSSRLKRTRPRVVRNAEIDRAMALNEMARRRYRRRGRECLSPPTAGQSRDRQLNHHRPRDQITAGRGMIGKGAFEWTASAGKEWAERPRANRSRRPPPMRRRSTKPASRNR